jgi:hypothetical protein
MAKRPVIILHGYSDKPESAGEWLRLLRARDYDATEIMVGGYVSLSNEVTIKDVAEAFDRALRARKGLGGDEEFDVIVHSTGMLVIRAWLTSYGLQGKVGEKRQARLKHLIGLAPATFGSPMAHKGRSWIGALVKGSKEVGHPDFLEAGDQILSALELGSKYTWDLAHLDFLKDIYGPDQTSPYPFVLIGTEGYKGLRKLAQEAGTDGTVRWAGCGFNTRKIVLDLSVDASMPIADADRAEPVEWSNENVPLAFVQGYDHGSIFTSPETTSKAGPLVAAVTDALSVESAETYRQWGNRYAGWSDQLLPPGVTAPYQQFVTHVVDERGDSVSDYFIELCTDRDGEICAVEEFEEDVHSWRENQSYRCFHVNLGPLAGLTTLYLHLSARSGTRLVGYYGVDSERMKPNNVGNVELSDGVWDARIQIPAILRTRDGRSFKLFYPFTTTLLEIRLNREPSFGVRGRVFWFESDPVKPKSDQ